jgi:hypothetical protein
MRASELRIVGFKIEFTAGFGVEFGAGFGVGFRLRSKGVPRS